MEIKAFSENGLNLVFGITGEEETKLLHFSALPFDRESLSQGVDPFYPVGVQISGLDRPRERHGLKYVCTSPGYRLKFRDLLDRETEEGRRITLVTWDEETGLEVQSIYQFYTGIPVIRCMTRVENKGKAPLGLEYLSSFALSSIEKEGSLPPDKKLRLFLPHNGWQKEFHWNDYGLGDLGYSVTQPQKDMRTSKTISVSNTGNWSTKEFLPMGVLENREVNACLFWQIEHNGSWHWEIADEGGRMYLQLSGPTETQSHWWKSLKPGESFTSVPVSVGSVRGEGKIPCFDLAMGALTRYRRAIRRDNWDNRELPVIFNDYMNCLWGDPTTEKELPLIEKAREAGCQIYCVDAGWYSDGPWWNGVGEWLPAQKRFPGGFQQVLDAIREKGMIPGVWLELEVMGIKCPLAEKVPKEWFFLRHGEKVYDRSRYQLDFRNPQVIRHADEVIRRLVEDYGVGYIKMDYNIEPGIGTEGNADSFGDGLLCHQRAYLRWLDRVFARYPKLIIENCSSGGLRMDYAMLSRYSIQSTSDQEDYTRYATIAANAPTGVAPEQAAVWSYPLEDGDWEETAFNLVNAMLLRIHQSGHLANLSPDRFNLVREGISCYKAIRGDIGNALPFWPLGLSRYEDGWVSLGLKTEKKTYVAVWRRNSPQEETDLALPHLLGKKRRASLLYPQGGECGVNWEPEAGVLHVRLPHPVSARLFCLEE